jgi:hypothetical protein
MDPQIEKFLNDYADKTLAGSGFIASAPKEKEELKPKLIEYFSDLIFDTLLHNLTDAQVDELQAIPDLASEEAQQKIAMMSASIPGFIFILEDHFDKASEEIGRTGRIPDLQTQPLHTG